MSEPLTPRIFAEFEGARRQRKSVDSTTAANAVLAEIAKRAVPRVRDLARRTLRFVMTDIFRRHLPPPRDNEQWYEGAEFMLWRSVLNGPNQITPEEVADVRELSEEAGGWWSGLGEELFFVERDEWNGRYRDWLRGTRGDL